MRPYTKFELFMIKLKCFLGLHDWVWSEDGLTMECWECGKQKGAEDER